MTEEETAKWAARVLKDWFAKKREAIAIREKLRASRSGAERKGATARRAQRRTQADSRRTNRGRS